VKDFELQVDPITGQSFTTIGGHRVEVRDAVECEKATFVVCVPAAESKFMDNVHTTCAFCGAAIVHRPHVPKTPPKICLDCMLKLERRES